MVGATRRQGSATGTDYDEVDLTALAAPFRHVAAWARRRGLSGDRVVLAGGLLVALALGLWLTAGAWGGRPPSGDDTMAHLVRADFAIDKLIGRGRVDGWHPGFILGYQEFLFLGPGHAWAVAMVQGLSLGLLSVAGALKVVTIGSLVLVPLTVAFVARSFGLSRAAAAVASILALAVNNPFGVGLQGVFNVGLLSHQVGALFFFVALGGALRVLQDPRRRWMVLTAVATSALLLTHIVSVIVFAAMFAVMLAIMEMPVRRLSFRREPLGVVVGREVQRQLRQAGLVGEEDDDRALAPSPAAEPWRSDGPSRAAFVRLAIAFAAAAALSACWLVPLLAHRELEGVFAGWGTPPLGTRLAGIWRGELLLRPHVAMLVLAGFAWGLVQAFRGRRYALVLAATPLAYLVVAHAGLNLLPANVSLQQLSIRGLGYAGVLAVLPLADLVVAVCARVGAGAVAAVAVAVAVVVVPLGPTRAMARQTAEPIPPMREAAQQLARLVPDGARFATQRDFPSEIGRTKVTNPDRWLAWASGRDTLNNFHITSSQTAAAAGEPEHVLDRPPEAVADAMSRLGVTHLVTVSDEAADRLSTSGRFRLVWRSSPLAIFGVTSPEGQPEPASLLATDGPASAVLVRAEPEHLEIDVVAGGPTRATLAIGWSPKWHARFDGADLQLRRADDGLIEVGLPAVTGRLTLDFRQDGWDYLGQTVSVATLVAGGWWAVGKRRRAGLRRARH